VEHQSQSPTQPRREGAEVMKAISLYQPFASLMAIGAKIHETRGWPTKHRGPLAICAGKSMVGWKWIDAKLDDEIFEMFGACHNSFPYGTVVAVVDLIDCLRVEDAIPDEFDRKVGDYSPGRFAWKCANPRPINCTPIRGMQGLFNIPDIDILSSRPC